MGLSNSHTDSIPLLLIAAIAVFFAYLRRLFGFSSSAATSATLPAGILVLADFLSLNRAFSYEPNKERMREDCVVCLSSMKRGEKSRRLNCCHVFHSDCLDGWFDQMKLSCPLCRSPL